jgi:hypothetical protein
MIIGDNVISWSEVAWFGVCVVMILGLAWIFFGGDNE